MGILLIIFDVGFIILKLFVPQYQATDAQGYILIKSIYDISMYISGISAAILIPFMCLLYVKYNFIPHSDEFEQSESCLYLIKKLSHLFCFDLYDSLNCNCCNLHMLTCITPRFCSRFRWQCGQCTNGCARCCCMKIIDPLCCDICFHFIEKVLLHGYCCGSCWAAQNNQTGYNQHRFNEKCKQIFIRIISIWLLFVTVIFFLQQYLVFYFLCRILMIVSDIVTEQSKTRELRSHMWKVYCNVNKSTN